MQTELQKLIKYSSSLSAKALFSFDKNWRATGYVDLYQTTKYLEKCTRAVYSKSKYEYVTIGGRRFKTVPKQNENLKCIYGNWTQIPRNLKKNWNAFSDDTQ